MRQQQPASGRSQIFTVRVWPEDTANGVEHRGIVRAVDGAFHGFREWSELIRFLTEQLEGARPLDETADQLRGQPMSFMQIIEFRTEDSDAVRTAGAEYWTQSEGKRTVRRSITATDHNDPSRHFLIALFDTYESAMENSQLQETKQAAQRLAGLAAGPPSFLDLDIVDDRA